MKKGKYTQFLIDLVVLFLSVKTGSFICSILERTSINVWIDKRYGCFSCGSSRAALLDNIKKKEKNYR